MQVCFPSVAYGHRDMAKVARSLKALREAAGISQRELARQLGEHWSNVSFWERTGNLPRSNVLMPMAKILGVTVEELLGGSKPKHTRPAGGRLGELFEAATKLPRRQQQKVVELLELFVSKHGSRK